MNGSRYKIGLVGSNRFELSTSRLSGARSNQLSYEPVPRRKYIVFGGDEGARTPDPLLAKQVLSQLSYTPILRRGSLPLLLLKLPEPQKLNNDCKSALS